MGDVKRASVDIDLDPCEASLDVDVDVTLQWGFLLPNELSIVASGDFAAALEFTADVSAELVVAPPRTRLVGTSIPVQLGPINATLDFDIYAGYEVNASANLHLHSGFELTAGVEAGFRWEKGENVGPIWDTDSSWTPIGPDITLTGSLEAEVYLEPQLSFLVFGAAGPSVTLHTYLGASADATVTNETETSSGSFDVDKEVCVELFAGVEPELGARVEVFGTELFDDSADCDDGVELTVDACDLAANTCTHELPRTTDCVGPGCCETDEDCDDGSLLTVDTCGATGFCENTTARTR